MISPTLLITDDDDAFRETLRDVFEPEGFRTFLAEDGLEAFHIVKTETIHLALLDYQMPRLDGLETIRLFRKVKPELPCILLSAALNEAVIEKARQLFVRNVLSKPFSRKQITAIVREALENR
ncbi:MAG: response regulator [Planctomycetaceae bacterium]|jgi:CheY-like chemotaxis protein|nr:response regulator [Planctomycetaceae bacterium]